LSERVTESMIGILLPVSAATSSAASIAAFELSVSKMVSISSISTPPSTSARICSLYAILKSSKFAALNIGSSTLGLIEAVLLVGPIEPATNLGLSGVLALYSSAASRAILAAARFISLAKWLIL